MQMRGLTRSLKHFVRRGMGAAIDPFVSLCASSLAPFISYMARTGTGTDACLRLKCLPVPVHFYSPVPDISDLRVRNIWQRKSDLPGIDFDSERQVAFLLGLGKRFGSECDWPPHPAGDRYQFYSENNSFSYGCAATTYSMIRHFRPRRVIEIGSGNSSLIISSALARNKGEEPFDGGAEYTVVDPYPSPIVQDGASGATELIEKQVEVLDPALFERLGSKDILFIDSSHTVKVGSDVNYLILDVLPRLNTGVIIHFHDVNLPYEYPETYATNPRFRMFWTESYLLQAFLSLNDHFEILLAMSYLMTEHKEAFAAGFPLWNPANHRLSSSSFWIRRIS